MNYVQRPVQSASVDPVLGPRWLHTEYQLTHRPRTPRNPIGLAPVQNENRACARRCRYTCTVYDHSASERRRDCAPVVLRLRTVSVDDNDEYAAGATE